MNELSALDLSENPALTKLWCYDNQLSELDLSKNTALETILCYDNYLTTLYLNNSHILPDYDINHIKDEYPDITIEYVD